MTALIDNFRLSRRHCLKYCFMPLILVLIGSMAVGTAEAQEAPPISRQSIGFLKSLGITVTPHEKGDESILDQRVFKTAVGQKQARVYCFYSKKMKITYSKVKLTADPPEDWKFKDFDKEEVYKGQKLCIRIVFQPQKKRASKAILSFNLKAKLLGPNIVTVEIPLIGEGLANISQPKLDQGGGKNKPRDTNAKKLCLDFMLVDHKDSKKWDKKAAEWTRKSNEIFKNNKVKIVFSKPNPVRKITRKDLKKEADKATSGQLHCFPVFIVKKMPAGVPAGKSGYTSAEYVGDGGPTGKEADKLAKKHKIHQKYRKGMVYGTAIFILQKTELTGVVLAHELGHALGGGAGERVPEQEVKKLEMTEKGRKELAERQNGHFDPAKGTPIKEAGRLMYPVNINKGASFKISALEKIIMEWTAKEIVVPALGKCNKTYKSLIGDYGMIKYANISNRGEELLLIAGLSEPLMAEGSLFNYQLSFNSEGTDTRVLLNTYDGESWHSQLEGRPANINLEPAIRFLRHPDGSAYALAARIPKDILPKRQGIIGWNIFLEVPKLGIADSIPLLGEKCPGNQKVRLSSDLKALPSRKSISSPVQLDKGFDCFDITNPLMALQASGTGEFITAMAGDSFEIEGSLAVSNTFSGKVELYIGFLHPESGIVKEFLAAHLSNLQPPINWSAPVRIPSDLDSGMYQLVITAVCELCKTETTALGPMVKVRQLKKLIKSDSFIELDTIEGNGSHEENGTLSNSKDNAIF